MHNNRHRQALATVHATAKCVSFNGVFFLLLLSLSHPISSPTLVLEFFSKRFVFIPLTLLYCVDARERVQAAAYDDLKRNMTNLFWARRLYVYSMVRYQTNNKKKKKNEKEKQTIYFFPLPFFRLCNFSFIFIRIFWCMCVCVGICQQGYVMVRLFHAQNTFN